MNEVHEIVLPEIFKLIHLEPIILCLFVLFAMYIFYHYIQCQMRKLNIQSYLFQRTKGSSTHIYNIESCPICLGEFKVPVLANCSHAFCMQCLLNYFNSNNYWWKCICPLCRVLINDVHNLHTFNFGKKETAKIKKMEMKLRNFIEAQNSSIKNTIRLKWIFTNKWKSVFILFSLVLFSTCIIFWHKLSLYCTCLHTITTYIK